MSLDDRIAEARERAERTLDPDDFKVLRALEAVETARPAEGLPAGHHRGHRAGMVGRCRKRKTRRRAETDPAGRAT